MVGRNYVVNINFDWNRNEELRKTRKPHEMICVPKVVLKKISVNIL